MRLVFILFAILITLPVAGQPAKEPADVLFTNGNIYTVNERQPKAQAVAVRQGRLVFVGSNQAAKGYQGSRTRVVDLHGATVVPGLTDSHYHLAGVGEREISFNLEGTASLSDLLARLSARLKSKKPGEWVVGRGWIETHWTPPAFPTRLDLDKVSPNNPVFLVRADGHGAVANSLALVKAGITKETRSPSGGEIVKDPATGAPTGMLLDAAQRFVTRLIPPPASAEYEQALLLGVQRSLALGWCQVQIPGNSWEEVALIQRLYREGKIKLRIYNAVSANAAQRLLQQGPTLNAFDHHFTVRGIKLYADGALGSKGAALLEPYEGETASGFMTTSEETVMPILQEALRRGIQIETHAIGDRANRTVLDWYAKAFAAVPPEQRAVKAPRWRIEHAQIVHADDIPRFAKLGVIPSMQPSHAIGDLHFAPSRLGIRRLGEGYAWQSFLKSGSVICGGSDAPVERGEPMIEFYAAVARKDLKGFSGEGWHPEQAVSRLEALKMFTLWAAYAAFEEERKGTLEPGKLADMTVLSADIMQIPIPEIPKTRCLMTIISGEIVYDAHKKNP